MERGKMAKVKVTAKITAQEQLDSFYGWKP